MCRKCGKVKTHTGFLMKKLVSGSRTFWFRSPIGKFSLGRRGVRGGLKKILTCHDIALVDVAYFERSAILIFGIFMFLCMIFSSFIRLNPG